MSDKPTHPSVAESAAQRRAFVNEKLKAFPQIEGWKEGDVSEIRTLGGMDLRDYFAAKAMQAALALAPPDSKFASAPNPDTVTEYAYRVADSMMLARFK